MWDTVAGVAHVLCLATGNVEMDPQQDVLLHKKSIHCPTTQRDGVNEVWRYRNAIFNLGIKMT
jgi:hypothetical protein